MPTWLTQLFSLTREISSKVALPIFITVFLILFLPASYASLLAIDQFRDAYRIWLGVVMILTASALVCNGLWLIGGLIKPWIKQTIYIRVRRGSLRGLTVEEKQILGQFIFQGEASVRAEFTSGAISLLSKKQIVMRASNVAVHYMTFEYIMQPWAREYLEKHPQLLE